MIIALAFTILLFFAAGKTAVLATPRGNDEMNQYGHCSQGLVFPRSKAQCIADFFEDRKVGYVDVLTGEYADEHAEFRVGFDTTGSSAHWSQELQRRQFRRGFEEQHAQRWAQSVH